MHSPDLTERNIERIAELFPSVITESRDGEGRLVRAVDFDLLRQELSDHVVDGPRERYGLNWPGKREALFTANAPIAKTLRPVREESVNFDTTQNLFIEGDNLDALKLLQESYLGKVKLIYIDPPYNTGNDFIYNDDFSESTAEFLEKSGQVDDDGNRLVANTESNGRFHSDWLSMMYPRLKLARNLLREDGVIFISIDDNEAANLRKLVDEVFGAAHFVAQIAVQVNPRGRHLDRYIAKTHESILVYTRGTVENALVGLEKSGAMVAEYDREDARGPYRLLGLRNRNQAFNPTTRPNLYYPLYVAPSTGAVSVTPGVDTVEVLPDAPDGVRTCWTWSADKVRAEFASLTAEPVGNQWRIFRKDYLHDADGAVARTLPKSVWADAEFSNDYGRKAVKALFGAPVMDFPKAPGLMRRLLEIGCAQDGIVLDFFAGSATLAQAMFELNATDGHQRSCVLCQLPEVIEATSAAGRLGFETLADVSKERVRLAGESMREVGRVDCGFRVLRVDSTNLIGTALTPVEHSQKSLLESVESIKPDRTAEDLVFQVLLDWGLELSVPIVREELAAHEVFDVDNGAVLACFDETVSLEAVEGMARREPLRAVFRASAFATDADRINAEQLFAQYSPATDVKAI